jgi:hypothetical protein
MSSPNLGLIRAVIPYIRLKDIEEYLSEPDALKDVMQPIFKTSNETDIQVRIQLIMEQITVPDQEKNQFELLLISFIPKSLSKDKKSENHTNKRKNPDLFFSDKSENIELNEETISRPKRMRRDT